MAAGLIGLEIFAVPLAGVFGLSGNTQGLCISAIRIISLSFVCAGINIAAQGIFQALDKGGYSLVISVLRQLLLVLPVAFGFALIAKKNTDLSWLVWLTFPIAEILSAVTAMIFLRKTVPQGKAAEPCTFPESVV